jgi:hypothetical protein
MVHFIKEAEKRTFVMAKASYSLQITRQFTVDNGQITFMKEEESSTIPILQKTQRRKFFQLISIQFSLTIYELNIMANFKKEKCME